MNTLAQNVDSIKKDQAVKLYFLYQGGLSNIRSENKPV